MSKLILTTEVTGLGSAGDVVDVKNGYARNYLVPQGFAVPWTRGGEKQVEQLKAARAARELATLEEAQSLKARLEESAVTLTAKAAGREGRLFGSVTTADVAAAVEAAGLGSIDKRTVELTAPIKATGRHEATVRLRSDVVAAITLQVVAAK
jgi:large subunit ribosomal protein L9